MERKARRGRNSPCDSFKFKQIGEVAAAGKPLLWSDY